MIYKLINSQAFIAILISLFSVFISAVALIINYLNYKRYAPKLKFKFLIEKSCLIPKSIRQLDGYKTDEFVVISYKISNTSAQPITIDEVTAQAIDHKGFPKIHQEFTFDKISHQFSNTLMFNFNPNPPAKLPLRIQPYDSAYVSFRFPFSCMLQKPILMSVVTPLRTYCLEETPYLWPELVDYIDRKHQVSSSL